MNFFEDWEWECPCCGKNNMQHETKVMLDVARFKANTPFVLNSACRCEKHNIEVKGSPTSSHLKGLAVDIKYNGNEERYDILNGLIYAGFKRIGIGSNFIHADSDKSKTEGLVWLYEGV